MANVLWWAGGSGAFTDPNFYLDPGSDQGPFGPPGPSDFVDYLDPGTVLFSGNSTGVAYINAAMVFDLTGGGFTLDPTANPIAELAFDSNTIPENPVDSLTVTGKNTLATPEITAGNLPITLTITDGATVAVSGQVVGLETGTQLSVTDNGYFAVKGGALNIVPDVFATGAETTLVAEGGTISAQSIGITAEQLSITGSILTASGNTMFPTIGGAIELTLDASAATALIQDSSLTASGATGSISITAPMITLAGAENFAAHSTTVHGTTSLVVSSGAAVKVAGGLVVSVPTTTVNTGAMINVTGALQLAGGAVTTTGATINVGSTITVGPNTSLTVSQNSTASAADIIEIGLLTINSSSVTTNTMEIAQAAGAPIDNVHVQNGRLTVSGTLTVGGGVAAVPVPFGGLDADVAARITAGSVDIGAGGTTNLEGNIGLDTNAILTVTNNLVVGDTGTGDLLVHSGATVMQTGGTVDLGAKATGVGTLTLDHAGASANFSGSTTVGDAGQGTINLSNSAMLQTTGVSAGSQANATGAVNVDGDSTVWDASDDVTIGASGTGSLGITNGGAANLSGKLDLAMDKGSHATVTLNGASSVLTVAELMTIGGAGLATVNVQLGATLNAQDVLLGQAMAPAGGAIDPDTGLHLTNVDVVNINGGGEINASMLTVGEAGYGALIFAGGVVVAEGAAILADQATSEAQIIVDGTASSLTTDDLTVGQSGKARLTVGSLNAVVTHGNAIMAAVKGSQATVILGDDTEQTPGSGHANWTIDAALTVGEGGSATLLSNASTLDVGGSTFTIGDAQGSNGLLTMNASQLLFGGHLVIGNQGKGELLFQEGSTSTVGAGVATPAITVGAQTGGSGSLIVTGTGTRMQANELQVGAFGKGAAQVTGGAELEVSGPVAVATQEEGIIQVLTVSGPSDLSVGSELAIGEVGVGALQVMTGGTLAVGGNVSIGESKAASGIATITGSNTTAGKPHPSSLNWGGTLIVGDLGVGTLLVENCASVCRRKGTVARSRWAPKSAAAVRSRCKVPVRCCTLRRSTSVAHKVAKGALAPSPS
jgi:autotransporter family porin